MNKNDSVSIATSKTWVERFIIGLDICPFAQYIPEEQIKYREDQATDLATIFNNIQQEWQYLLSHRKVETSLIIYPNASADFLDFLDDYYACEQRLEDLGLDSTFQLVAFHPQFLFDASTPDDPANFTNRSPYPMIHILRSDSVTKAVDDHPDIESIPVKNMEKLRKESVEYWESFL
jgi:hypothetical protein